MQPQVKGKKLHIVYNSREFDKDLNGYNSNIMAAIISPMTLIAMLFLYLVR